MQKIIHSQQVSNHVLLNSTKHFENMKLQRMEKCCGWDSFLACSLHLSHMYIFRDTKTAKTSPNSDLHLLWKIRL